MVKLRFQDGLRVDCHDIHDAKRTGAAWTGHGWYRIFQKQHGKWHMVFDSALGY